MLYLMMDIRILLFLYPEHTLNYQDLFQVSIIELTVWTTALLCWNCPCKQHRHQTNDR